MKKLLFVLVLATGCASQKAEKIAPDGSRTTYQTRAFFAKTAFDGLVVDKTGKATSQLLGVKGYGAESQAEAIAAFMDSIKGIFEAGVKAGTPIP